MRNKPSFLFLIIFLFLTCEVLAQNQEKLLTVFIYNFAINGEWTQKESTTEFVIGVITGDDAMTKELQTMADLKMIGKRKITVLEFAKESDVKDCHILFIPESKSGMFQSLNSRLSGTSTLIITEKAGLAKFGSGINFVRIDGKLRYEINTGEIDKRNIKMSSKITSLGLPI